MNESNTVDVYQPELFRLLSDCYIVPDVHLKESIVALVTLVAKAYPQLEEDARILLKTVEESNNLEALRVEFTRLFIGPYSMLAPPYESVYQTEEGVMMGNSTMEIIQLYRQAGFELAEDYHESPDHISAELEFLYILFAKLSSAKVSGRMDAAELYDSLLKSLLTDHMIRWIPELTVRVETHSNLEFYRALARLTRTVIVSESEQYLLQ